MKRWFRTRKLIVAGACFELLVTQPAYANAGTPLMWLGLGHLLFGNLAIGIGEGLLAAWWLKLRKPPTIGIFILANYFSMAVGVFLFTFVSRSLTDKFPQTALVYGATWLILFGCMSWFMSVVLEWPFCLWAVRKLDHRLRRATVLSLGAQAASYAILVPLYLCVSSLSLYTTARIVTDTKFTANPQVELYYVKGDTRDIWSIRLDGSGNRRITTQVVPKRFRGMYLLPMAQTGQVTLMADVYGTGIVRLLDAVEVSPNIVKLLTEISTSHENGLQDLRPVHERPWTVRGTAWGEILVSGPLSESSKPTEYRLSLETPFLSAGFNHVTRLPHDEVIAELNDCIVLIHLPSRRIGFLTKGKAPVVVSIPEQP